MDSANLESILNSINVTLPDNIKYDIMWYIYNNKYMHKHVCFIIDLKNNSILTYDVNVYFKTESFPFSVHAEIQTITKLYKSKSINKNKKALLVVKLSKSGILSNSKCCLNCARYIKNNIDNLNLKCVYYSMPGNNLYKLNKDDLDTDKNFRYSKGFNNVKQSSPRRPGSIN